ncbi:MAG: DUF72 domain-containing protein [Chloroflexi bacterium]|nr:DUF72 domain-containing protein [Chloroflexota bacterium]
MAVQIGTSGWMYRHWRQTFYPLGVPQKRWLEFYAQRFATVESNNAFYMLLKGVAIVLAVGDGDGDACRQHVTIQLERRELGRPHLAGDRPVQPAQCSDRRLEVRGRDPQQQVNVTACERFRQ